MQYVCLTGGGQVICTALLYSGSGSPQLIFERLTAKLVVSRKAPPPRMHSPNVTSPSLTFPKGRLRHHYCVAKPGRSRERGSGRSRSPKPKPLPAFTPRNRAVNKSPPSAIHPSPNFNHPSVSSSPRAILGGQPLLPSPFVHQLVSFGRARDPSIPTSRRTPRERAREGAEVFKSERAKWVRDCGLGSALRLSLSTQDTSERARRGY